jgi:hypothetical protein
MENNYKKTERWLYHMNALITRIENLKQEYRDKELEAEGEGIDYSKDRLCETYKFNSSTENTALELVHLKMMIESLQNRVCIMERSLGILNGVERKVIDMKYRNGDPWYNIAYQLKYSERQCRYIRTIAVKKLATAIFGDE